MSKIEWTEQTWNPIIGCSKISQGCKNCYAETMAHRLAHMRMNQNEHLPEYENVIDWKTKGWNGKTHFVESALDKPLNRKKPTMYFVCSMGDLFHESVPFEWIDKVIDVIRWTKQHTFQILTKRPERMKEYFNNHVPNKYLMDNGNYLDNLWIGVTAENQQQANKRIPLLLQIPAKVRFVSIEPMLSEVEISSWLYPEFIISTVETSLDDSSQSKVLQNDIHWVICGGESGHNARPMHPDWVRSLRDQCKDANVPFFFKQWGKYCMVEQLPDDIYDLIDLSYMGEGIYYNFGKKKAGSLLDGKEYKQYPKIK